MGLSIAGATTPCGGIVTFSRQGAVVGADQWQKVLGLLVSNPELLYALLIVFGALAGLLAGTAVLAWVLRAAIDKGQIGNLNSQINVLRERLELASEQLEGANNNINQLLTQSKSSNQGAGTRLLTEAATSTTAAMATLTAAASSQPNVLRSRIRDGLSKQ
jgi:hypothetical protein